MDNRRILYIIKELAERVISKKIFWLSASAFIAFMTLYSGSYWYLRNKTLNLEKKLHKENAIQRAHIPSGYYIGITYGVGLSSGSSPPQGAMIYCCWINSKGLPEHKEWLLYLYYPLLKLETETWRLKNFGW